MSGKGRGASRYKVSGFRFQPVRSLRNLTPETRNPKQDIRSSTLLESKSLTIFSEKGVSYANWNDWSWKDGREHGTAAAHGRPSVRRFRHVAYSSAGI